MNIINITKALATTAEEPAYLAVWTDDHGTQKSMTMPDVAKALTPLVHLYYAEIPMAEYKVNHAMIMCDDATPIDLDKYDEDLIYVRKLPMRDIYNEHDDYIRNAMHMTYKTKRAEVILDDKCIVCSRQNLRWLTNYINRIAYVLIKKRRDDYYLWSTMNREIMSYIAMLNPGLFVIV